MHPRQEFIGCADAVDVLLQRALGDGRRVVTRTGLALTVQTAAGLGLGGQRSAMARYTNDQGVKVAERHLVAPTPEGRLWWTVSAVRMHVESPFQRQGVATALQDTLWDALRGTGVDDVRVHAEDMGRRRWALDYDWLLDSKAETWHNLGALWRGWQELGRQHPATAPSVFKALSRRLGLLTRLTTLGPDVHMSGPLARLNNIGVPRAVVVTMLTHSPARLSRLADGAGRDLLSCSGDWLGCRHPCDGALALTSAWLSWDRKRVRRCTRRTCCRRRR